MLQLLTRNIHINEYAMARNSSTEPGAFFLDVFFNAHSLHLESKDKQRAPNALVPTVIAYAGGQTDFMVDMGVEVRKRSLFFTIRFIYWKALAFHAFDNNQGWFRKRVYVYLWRGRFRDPNSDRTL